LTGESEELDKKLKGRGIMSRKMSALEATPTLGRDLVEDLRLIARVAEAQGVAVWLVGGPVRDALLGLAVQDVEAVEQVSADWKRRNQAPTGP
jgi:hypothetical protein